MFRLFSIALWLLLAVAVIVPADEVAPAPAPAEADTEAKAAPAIEVVFVLDTTGSMSGLIEAAKQKIWSIASTLATTKPTPDIRMGLVGYRDRGDDYITQRTDLSTDLDAVFTKLMGFQAGGGGDMPESVNQALSEAVRDISWSKDETTYRVIYLVGDCPPHMDYQDDVKYPVSCREAVRRDIIINTIQCGNHQQTVPIWKEIAKLAEGQYFQVEQSGGAVLASTPFDDDLSALSKDLDGTRLYYGDEKEQAAQADKRNRERAIYAEAPAASVASRATFNAKEGGKTNFAGQQELVSAVVDGALDLKDVDETELPEELRKLTPAEREARIAELAKQRDAIRQRIDEVSEKRKAYLREEAKKRADAGQETLDAALFDSIRRQAAEKNIHYAEEAQDF